MSLLGGRVAIVTGANAGIGWSISRRLVQEGMRVIGWDKSTNKMEKLPSEVPTESGMFYPMKCDLREEEEILQSFADVQKQFGGVHLMVNNAGVLDKSSILDGATDRWRNILNVNFLATAICTREAIHNMMSNNITDGHVINISSIHAHHICPVSHTHFYASTKFAIRGLTEAVRQELRDRQSGIRVACISPGMVETEITSAAAIAPDLEQQTRQVQQKLKPSEIADMLVYTIKQPKHVQIHDIIVHAHNEPR